MSVQTIVRRIASWGVAEDDHENVRLVKGMFTIVASATVLLSFVWVIVYFALGVPRSAAIPLAYQVLTVGSLAFVARTKRFKWFHNTQMTMYLVFPFVLMWSLGGFANGSAVGVWAVSAPLIAVGDRPWRWMGGFVGLAIASGLLDGTLAESAPDLASGATTVLFALNLTGAGFVVFLGLAYSIRERNAARAALAVKHEELIAEQERSQSLLLNILPPPIARRMLAGEDLIADHVPAVTVLFADIVGFTSLSADMSPGQVVSFLNGVFGDLDDLADRLGLDKIKTLGDGYMAVGNATRPLPNHLDLVLDMALAMRDEIAGREFGQAALQFRIGIDAGVAVGAIIGKRRFTYDLWGNAVNAASRMESHGTPGEIQVTARVAGMAGDRYQFERRGEIDVKGIGMMETFILRRRIPPA